VSLAVAGFEPSSSALKADAMTTGPRRQSVTNKVSSESLDKILSNVYLSEFKFPGLPDFSCYNIPKL
jgi:hypothetical protein